MQLTKYNKHNFSYLYWIGLLFAAIPLFVIFTGQWNFLTYDDTEAVVNNSHIQTLNLENLKWMLTDQALGSYEPISWFIKAVLITFFGHSITAFHITSALFHLANALLVMICGSALLRLYMQQKKIPFSATNVFWCYASSTIAGGLFALSPLRAEVIVWASAHAYSVGTFFLLVSLLCYLNTFTQENKTARTYAYIGTLVFYICAIFGKSSALLLPLCFILLDLLLNESEPFIKRLRKSLLNKTPFFIIMLATFYMIYQTNLEAMGGTITSLAWPERLGRAIIALYVYPLQSIWPFNLTPNYPIPFWDIRIWAPLPLTLCVISLVIAWFLLANLNRLKWLAVALLAYFILSIAVLGFVQRGEIVLHADRYAYTSTIMLHWLLAGGLFFLAITYKNAKRAISAICLVVIALFAYLQTIQMSVWRNEESLWLHALKIHPYNTFAANNLGFKYFEENKLDLGRYYLEIAYKYKPSLSTALNLGPLYYTSNRCPLALEIYAQQLANHANEFALHHNIANCLYQQKRFALAKEHYEKAIALSNGHPLPNQVLQKMLADPEYRQFMQQQDINIKPNEVHDVKK